MEFTINRDVFLKSLSHAYGVIEKKNTLPILSNVLIEAKNSKIKITATDLDLIYSEEIPIEKLVNEGTTTTSASILYDILRKIESGAKVELSLQSANKLKLVSGKSKFNLLCISSDTFPLSDEEINLKEIIYKIMKRDIYKSVGEVFYQEDIDIPFEYDKDRVIIDKITINCNDYEECKYYQDKKVVSTIKEKEKEKLYIVRVYSKKNEFNEYADNIFKSLLPH